MVTVGAGLPEASQSTLKIVLINTLVLSNLEVIAAGAWKKYLISLKNIHANMKLC